MAQSLSKIYIHLTFHIKNNQAHIRQEDKKRLFAYIGTIIKDTECIPIKINGTSDHLHVLCTLSRNVTMAKLTEEIKRHSSRWIKTLSPYYSKFAWQTGYGVFSVSQSVVEKTISYIENQEIHHRRMSYKDELIAFLEEYKVDYDERYLTDE